MPGNHHRLYLGNISDDTRERDVEKFFKGYGKLREVALKNGYGFVEFEDHRDADDAVQDLDGKDMNGSRVRVEFARSPREKRNSRYQSRRSPPRGRRGPPMKRNPPGRRTQYRIRVENLSTRTSWQDLKDYFRSCGEITYTNAHKPRNNEGVVEFGDKRAMENALDRLDDTDLGGRRIKLYEEVGSSSSGSRRSRSYSREKFQSRSRSRSRDASRSRSRDDLIGR
ncbi:SFRS4_5_6 [Lepeophtheirus salmonis]|uniref:SFRS4_5_6 n=1 Tax=Lepeophtheirus salmonis TaxID=72036 RepID=A0A7R8CIT6_LEPSM|nr:SFRS4_5_6 [Lepeophtheirus salmonis]CAF2798192.1 SFRS4_5_6 [Lepeophtheirus salmonis]